MARGRRPALKAASVATLERALANRKREVAALEKQRDALRAQLARVEADIEKARGAAVGAAPKAKRAKRVGRPRRRAKNKVTLKQAIAAALKDADKPMKAADVLAAITAAGYQSNAKGFKQTVHSALTLHPNAKRVSRGVYEYQEADAAPAGTGRRRRAKRKAAK